MSCLISKSTTDDRLPVLVSEQNGIKLLGVPWIQTHCTERIGKLVADATHTLLVQWGCFNCIRTMVFHTTASNTGHITAACIAVQQKLNWQFL